MPVTRRREAVSVFGTNQDDGSSPTVVLCAAIGSIRATTVFRYGILRDNGHGVLPKTASMSGF